MYLKSIIFFGITLLFASTGYMLFDSIPIIEKSHESTIRFEDQMQYDIQCAEELLAEIEQMGSTGKAQCIENYSTDIELKNCTETLVQNMESLRDNFVCDIP